MQPETPTLRSALALLGLPEGAHREAVTQAYHRLALTTHPDLSSAADAPAQFDALTAAYRQALAAAPTRAPEPASPPIASRTRTQPVRPSVTLFDLSGGWHPVIVAGPGRVEPLPAQPR